MYFNELSLLSQTPAEDKPMHLFVVWKDANDKEPKMQQINHVKETTPPKKWQPKKSIFFPIPRDILLHCSKDILRYSCLTLLHTDGVVGRPIQESAETDVMKGSKREKKKIIG